MPEIRRGVHLIDGLSHPLPGVGMVSYLVEESPHDLTLIDTCFSSDLPEMEEYVHNAGYTMSDIKRIVITHLHPDHTQSVNETKRRSGGTAEILSHWAEAAYLSHNPRYSGPPTHESFLKLLNHFKVKPEDVYKKYDHLEVDAIKVDRELQDGEMVGEKLQVIHTPGHTPGHISLYSKQYGIVFGADVMFKSILGKDGLFVPPSAVSIDSATAAISARRISNLKFDTLLLAHQDSPLMENAGKQVKKAVVAAGLNKP